MSDSCEWTAEWYNGDEYWKTSCKRDFVLEAGLPDENHYDFCPGCGKKIKVKGGD